ncbi:hypothetical protein BDV26DRAFT_272950 [Aspergillus bertholletiae]|uniref:Uncharacterized protein n=1 Tax=Aspergillus bertholletiae TaxID=1226010 RepID=A0A5N7AT42_9EURO|nr:hypothetical protein BDV26DRAFT_272950 [Aspergillus bertholletiae]
MHLQSQEILVLPFHSKGTLGDLRPLSTGRPEGSCGYSLYPSVLIILPYAATSPIAGLFWVPRDP